MQVALTRVQSKGAWFAYSEDILYVHDYDRHKTLMDIAIKAKPGWMQTLIEGSLGANLLNDYIRRDKLGLLKLDLAYELNEDFKLYGFFRF